LPEVSPRKTKCQAKKEFVLAVTDRFAKNLDRCHTARTMTQRAALPDLDTLNQEALKALILSQHKQLLRRSEIGFGGAFVIDPEDRLIHWFHSVSSKCRTAPWTPRKSGTSD
jgi:hypothetical protein